MKFVFTITLFVLVSGMMSCHRRLRVDFMLNKRQQAREDRNHGCKVTTRYSVAQLRSSYPYNIAHSVALVSFDQEPWGYIPIKNGEIDYSQIKESVVLTQQQIDSLAGLFYNVEFRGDVYKIWESGCYNPRNAVLFFDANHHLLEFIELCFECGGKQLSSEKIFVGDRCSEKYSMLRDFFARAGIKIGTTTRKAN